MAGNWANARSSALLGLAATIMLGAQPGSLNAPLREAVATVSGRVTFTGTIPSAQPIDMSGEAYCRDAEGQRGLKASRQQVIVGTRDGLGEVMVQIKGVPAQASRPVPSEPVVLDQVGCLYMPGALALRVGQPLIVRNSDNVLHNVHVKPKLNQPFNVGQPSSGMQSRRTFRMPEPDIRVGCDIHDWMQATISVFDHSFFATTASDGSFAIDGLPPGEYELEARHSVLGTRTQRIRVSETGAEPVLIDFGRK